MPTLAIAGTLVWDRIVPLTGPPVERWGGIGYALAAASLALPASWSIRPAVRVGADLYPRARELLTGLPRVDVGGLVEAAEPNNRVELLYQDAANRIERLSGGVGPWTAPALAAALEGSDALLVNFISGYEVPLDALRVVTASFEGFRYADLHSLFLGRAPDGTRVPRALPDWRSWAACFHAIQVNENEFSLMRASPDGPEGPEDLLSAGPHIGVVTRGSAGVTLVDRDTRGRPRRQEVTLQRSRSGDPTGCGDVWGGAMVARLAAGDTPRNAAEAANAMAAASVDHSGVEGLVEHLSREVWF